MLRTYGRLIYLKPVLKSIDLLKKQTVNTVNEAIGTGILRLARQNGDDEFLQVISKHHSDMVRCWTAYAIGRQKALDLSEKLDQIKILLRILIL